MRINTSTQDLGLEEKQETEAEGYDDSIDFDF